ncbi:MAG: hypothetical protein ACRCZ0_10360 [Cetobacterium sp.]
MSSDQIYCGNNLYELGNQRIGSPYQCLKKGIGRGLHLDLTDFNPNYSPIIPDNTYCGNNKPPPGKVIGTPTSCLRKGIGIGKKMQYDQRGIMPPPLPPQRLQLGINRQDSLNIQPQKPQLGINRQDSLNIQPQRPQLGINRQDSLNIQPQRPQLGVNRQDSLNIQPQRQVWVCTYDILKKWWPLILSVLVGTIAALFQISITNILLFVILTLITCWIIKTILDE